ncbi:TPA: delta(1)-pyrroline-2-carboxylate reductase family protein [Pseudomonas putida]|nr:delta(1)-pyrroline-2-carboxylate reductase family protein [Pseudomonas putida]
MKPIPSDLLVCDISVTERLLPFGELVSALKVAVGEHARGEILCPGRVSVSLPGNGLLLSMPATSHDIAVVKLITYQPGNAAVGIPTLHGQVSLYDAARGVPLMSLDGPTVTGRRTAAVTLLGVQELSTKPPKRFVIFGTGAQAKYHLQGIASLYPEAEVSVAGLTREDEAAFCERMKDVHLALAPATPEAIDSAEVVITVTTSLQPVYDFEAKPGKLIIGVGAFTPEMAEIGPRTLLGSKVYVDDINSTRVEAGDLIQSGISFDAVSALAEFISDGQRRVEQPIVFKCVGNAAWDLAAARVAMKMVADTGIAEERCAS